MQSTDFVTELAENATELDQYGGEAEIRDDAKRSVSIRINVSDYGKIKTIARRLRVRESTVFRYLLKDGLQSLAPLYQTKPSLKEVLEVLFEHPNAFLAEFRLDNKRLSNLLNGILDTEMDTADIEFIASISAAPKYLAQRLSDKLGLEVAEAQSVAMLKHYLLEKYTADPAPRP